MSILYHRKEVVAIAKREYTHARAEANARYDKETYKVFSFKLRKVDDKDIIDSIQAAKERGVNKREWLRKLFDGE